MATQNSDLIANTLLAPPVLNDPTLANGTLAIYQFSLVAAAGIDGEIYQLATVPRGQRVLAPYCRLNIPDQSALALIAMGFAAHQDAEGNVVAASAGAFFTALDVATGPIVGIVDTLTVTGLLEQRLMEGDAIITLTLTGVAALAGTFSGTIIASRV